MDKNEPLKFISHLKSGEVNSEDFDNFEQFVYSQTEELRLVKIHNETLRNLLNKCEDEKRSLELQLVGEKASHTKETKNIDLEKDKIKMQFDTKMYSMKCEVEMHTRKSEAIVMELDLLKEQLKDVEYEKGEAVRKLQKLTTNKTDFHQIKSSSESFQKRMRETVKMLERQFSQLREIKEDMAVSIENSQNMISKLNVAIQSLENSRSRWETRSNELERLLVKCQAENAQIKGKLERAEIVKESASALIDEMVVENENLFQGITVISNAVCNDIHATDDHFMEKIKRMHESAQESVKRLKLE